MEIKRETTVKVMSTDGKEINVGDVVKFEAKEMCLCGIFKGFAKRGALMFETLVDGSDLVFNIAPYAINKIYLVGGNE